MPRDIVISCAMCAWRQDCKKKFTCQNALHCPDYARDLSIKDPDEAETESSGNKED